MRAVMEPVTDKINDGQDERWDYTFGIDGLMTVEEVCDYMRISRDTVERMREAKELRHGKDPRSGRVKLCRRSVVEYVRKMEV